jgi:dihydroorotase
VDAGSAGWREFPDFRDRIIKTARTRVLAFLNIVGSGIGGGREDDPADMDPAAAAKTAGQNSDLIVGFKSAHYAGKGWESIDASVKAGNLCYSGHREELLENGTINPAMAAGRKRGIYFDVGHGAGSFYWYVAIPAYGQGFYPDSISTDLHADSMNAGMKDMPNIMSKHLRLGSSLQDVVRMATWNPAQEIRRPQLGNLDVGAEADIAVLRIDEGDFGFVDSAGARKSGNRLIVPEMTLRAGSVVWDLNGRASIDWKQFPYQQKSRRK